MGILLKTTGYPAQDGPAEEFVAPSATLPHRANLRDQDLFCSILNESAREALRNALGDVILGILAGQKMLENPDNTFEFTNRLRSVFGASGAKTLEFVIAKELYQRLNLPFNPNGSFDYATFLDTAKSTFLSKKKHAE